MQGLKSKRSSRERPPRREASETTSSLKPLPEDFVLRSSPWVDFSLTSFWMEDRVGNFLNLGVQVGGYFFDRLRVSARMVTPLEDVTDGYSNYSYYGSGELRRVDSRQMSVLYGASVGLLITSSKSFAFGPSLGLLHTDVNAYGSAVLLTLPFEWTTRKNLRVGFELSLGHAFSGSVRQQCRSSTSPVTDCGSSDLDRPGGTAVLFQYYMGWSLGHL
jgi:hypothetical protein